MKEWQINEREHKERAEGKKFDAVTTMSVNMPFCGILSACRTFTFIYPTLNVEAEISSENSVEFPPYQSSPQPKIRQPKICSLFNFRLTLH